MAKILTPGIPIGNNENDLRISFLYTVPITTRDIDVIASRIAVSKFLDLGWEVADLNNLVPFFSIRLVPAVILQRYLELGPKKFLESELTRVAYTMEKQDEIRRKIYTFPLNKAALSELGKRREQERLRGEVSRQEYIGGNKVAHVTYRGRKRKDPRILFYSYDQRYGNPQLRSRYARISSEVADLILKMVNKSSKFLPIDYLVRTSDSFLFVELKANKAKLSKKQLQVSKMIQDAGYKVAEFHVSLNLGPNVEIRCEQVREVKGNYPHKIGSRGGLP